MAVGLARSNNGEAGLAAVVAYLVTTEGARVLIPVPPAELADYDVTDTILEQFASVHKALTRADEPYSKRPVEGAQNKPWIRFLDKRTCTDLLEALKAPGDFLDT